MTFIITVAERFALIAACLAFVSAATFVAFRWDSDRSVWVNLRRIPRTLFRGGRQLHERLADWRDRRQGPPPENFFQRQAAARAARQAAGTGPEPAPAVPQAPPPPPRPVAPAPADGPDPDPFPDMPPLTGVVIPADRAAVHRRIASFVAEDDVALITFLLGEGASFLGEAEAWVALAEAHGDELGLDPSICQALAEVGTLVGEFAGDLSMAIKHVFQVYGVIMQEVADGKLMPYNGRWITGEIDGAA